MELDTTRLKTITLKSNQDRAEKIFTLKLCKNILTSSNELLIKINHSR